MDAILDKALGILIRRGLAMDISVRIIDWIRATRFREVMGLTKDQYVELEKKWKVWYKPVTRKKGNIVYVSTSRYDEWVEDDDTK